MKWWSILLLASCAQIVPSQPVKIYDEVCVVIEGKSGKLVMACGEAMNV